MAVSWVILKTHLHAEEGHPPTPAPARLAIQPVTVHTVAWLRDARLFGKGLGLSHASWPCAKDTGFLWPGTLLCEEVACVIQPFRSKVSIIGTPCLTQVHLRVAIGG